MLEYFDNQENAVILTVYPFPEAEASKEQGIKILEEASECREAYDVLAKLLQAQATGDENITDEVLQGQFYVFLGECCDVIQTVVNTVSGIMDSHQDVARALNEFMMETTNKNINRGYYGEITEEDNKRRMEAEGGADVDIADGGEQADDGAEA